MNDVQLLEKKVNACKKRELLWSGLFLGLMVFLGGYISKLPYQLAVLAIIVLFIFLALIVWNSIKVRKLKKELKLYQKTEE